MNFKQEIKVVQIRLHLMVAPKPVFRPTSLLGRHFRLHRRREVLLEIGLGGPRRSPPAPTAALFHFRPSASADLLAFANKRSSARSGIPVASIGISGCNILLP